MWRDGGALENYMYYAAADELRCGDSWPWAFATANSGWSYVKVFLRVNDLGASSAACMLCVIAT